MNRPIISVVGSINVDLVVQTNRPPEVGETIAGQAFYTMHGGKGANQAVAAARLGAHTNMIGRVGSDNFAADIVKSLNSENIFLSGVEPVTDESTGVASIVLSNSDNQIIIVPGANKDLTPSYLGAHETLLLESDVIITQLETPIETTTALSEFCMKHEKKLIVNPAPAQPLNETILKGATFLTPNAIELKQLISSHHNFMQKYAHKLIVTEGKEGCYFYENNTKIKVPSFKVEALDTTGAGDCFNGALAYQIAVGSKLQQACLFANAAAALAVQTLGAQPGMPTKEAVDEYLKN
ncbi:Ribokinase [Lentibacillus sp. JNUCC-1]|uniref:ribokinase n=1 Tax=Lentibacillus sp. JNUCC-1 TaxID=2654513 RepID=UPI0012E86E18|nr:ribokinase [Lentibacillus sp. JNUCC-1]MUV36764.1 Ribokinase [Lentibacillus sp. JNUCC-1]